MAQVTFSYTGQLAAAAGTSEETLDLADATSLRQALEERAARHGNGWARLVFDDAGRVRSTLLVVFDGVQAGDDRESQPLDGVKNVMLMTPIAGG